MQWLGCIRVAPKEYITTEGEFREPNTDDSERSVRVPGVRLATKLITSYTCANIRFFVHDSMQPALPTAWSDKYGAKSLYMAEGQLVSVEGRRF